MEISRVKQTVGAIITGSIVGTVFFGLFGLILISGDLMNHAGSRMKALAALLASIVLGFIAGSIPSLVVASLRIKPLLATLLSGGIVGALWVAGLIITQFSGLLPIGPGYLPPLIFMIALVTSPLIIIGAIAGLAASLFVKLTNPPK